MKKWSSQLIVACAGEARASPDRGHAVAGAEGGGAKSKRLGGNKHVAITSFKRCLAAICASCGLDSHLTRKTAKWTGQEDTHALTQ